MSNELSIFDGNNFAAPAYADDLFAGKTNLEKRNTVPTLSFEGKVWAVTMDGEKRRLTRTTEDGDEEPVSTMRVVILNAAPSRGRTYYEGSYDPNKIGSPKCWSDDGQKPHSSVQDPMSLTCKACPMAIKGSKVTDQGKPIVACSQHRMLAVVPASNVDSTPLRMKIAITSDWDADGAKGEDGKKGWYAFSNYKDFLTTRGVKHTAQIVTKIRFDNNVAYPKLLFAADKWLEPEDMRTSASKVDSDEVLALLGGGFTPNGADGTTTAAPAVAAPAPEPKPAPKPKTTPVAVETDDIDGVLDAWGDD